LLDEIFKGTNSIERIAMSKSVLSYLASNGNLVFVATHDRELAELLSDHYELYHFTEIIEAEQIVFDYKMKAGVLKTTNAIRILELNYFPTEIVDEAIRLASRP
jgi:DNA mismatch repair ATPase MutS